MKVVIIGAVAAGMSAAAKLKRIKPDYEVVVYEKTDIVSFGACGLPYYVGGFFTDSNMMIAREKSKFIESGIDLKTFKEVIDVDTLEKILTIKDALSGEIFIDNYDKLMIATGASSIMPSLDKSYDNLTTLKDMNDGIKLKKLISKEENKNIVIIGAGFIGIETIEAAKKLNKNIHLIGRSNRILSKVFDKEITDLLEEELRKNNIHLHLDETIQKYIGEENITKVITNKSEIDCDIVVMAIGVKPNTSFLENTNIKMLSNGAIIVDECGRTSVEDIYAAGDCASINHILKPEPAYIPLATVANKMGRIIGENLAGAHHTFNGSLASACLKVMNLEAGRTGLSEQEAMNLGINYKTVFITDMNQTSYYPGQSKINVKLIYNADTKVILGGQIVGRKDAVQRVNVLATAIFAGLTTDQLAMLDLCYAPPFARTWDVLNIAGSVAK